MQKVQSNAVELEQIRKLKKEQAHAEEDIKHERMNQTEASIALKQRKAKAEKEKLERLRHLNVTETLVANNRDKKAQQEYDKERAELDRKAIKDQHALLEKATR